MTLQVRLQQLIKKEYKSPISILPTADYIPGMAF